MLWLCGGLKGDRVAQGGRDPPWLSPVAQRRDRFRRTTLERTLDDLSDGRRISREPATPAKVRPTVPIRVPSAMP